MHIFKESTGETIATIKKENRMINPLPPITRPPQRLHFLVLVLLLVLYFNLMTKKSHQELRASYIIKMQYANGRYAVKCTDRPQISRRVGQRATSGSGELQEGAGGGGSRQRATGGWQ